VIDEGWCPWCPAAFATDVDLNRHLAHDHHDEGEPMDRERIDDVIDDVSMVAAVAVAFVIGAAGGLLGAGLVALAAARRAVQR
jgi:hypothetical protein